MTIRMKGAAALAGALMVTATAGAAEVTLNAVTGLPGPTPVAQVFLQYVERVNEAGKGVVQINYMGGPEVMPPARQAASLERGLIDILSTPASFYAGSVKEVDALLAVNKPMSEVREAGGIELISDIWEEQINARVLGWFDSSVKFNMYLSRMPEVTEEGLDLSGFQLFTTNTYRDFQEALGATPVAIEVGEIMTALDSGVIEGYGWPDYGLVALGFGRHTAVRIDPKFYAGNVPALINADKWESLPQEARDILTQEAIKWETDAIAFIQEFKDTEEQALLDGGMEILTLEGAAADAYLQTAYDLLWERIEGSGSPHVEALKDALYDPMR